VVKQRIAIVGLGLIGGSLARRLVNAGCDVTAWNHNDRPYATAEADGIVCTPTLAALADGKPDVLVLCNPLKAMPQILGVLKPLIDQTATTLTDVGSVKGMVRDQVKAVGLEGCYVGAHPMAGSELSGWESSDPALYDDALWAITVDDHTDYRRFLAVAKMVTDACANRLIVLDDATHDRCAALISHMPHVIATAMINELVVNPNRNIAAALAAGSWRDMTRVALTDPERTRAMVEEDAANVELLLRNMANRLTLMANVLHGVQAQGVGALQTVATQESDAREMTRFFAQGQPFRDYRAAMQRPGSRKDRETIPLEIPTEGWQQMLLESARRGEHIIRFTDDHAVDIQIRSAV
jgi:prephenate dehydrogenase